MAKYYCRFGVGRVRVLSTWTMTTRLTTILILQTHLPCHYCAYDNIPTRDCGMCNAVVTICWCKPHSILFSALNSLHLLRLSRKLKDERRNDTRGTAIDRKSTVAQWRRHPYIGSKFEGFVHLVVCLVNVKVNIGMSEDRSSAWNRHCWVRRNNEWTLRHLRLDTLTQASTSS